MKRGKLAFNWKGRFPNRGVKPEDAWDELERIREEEGDLTSKIVVDQAKKKRNPLHPIFDWEDGIAADKWRLAQAGNIIRAIEVRVMTKDGKPSAAIRALTCIEQEDDEGNVASGIYVRTLDELGTAEDQAKHELVRWRNKWKDIQEVAKLVDKVSLAVGI